MKVILILLSFRGAFAQNLRSSGIKEDILPNRSIFDQEHLEQLSKEIKVLQENDDHAAAAELTTTYRSRKLIKDADRKNTCFQDKGNYKAFADYHEDPFKANNDRGDWGKCLPEELFGIMCEHEIPHKLNYKDDNPKKWKMGDGPLHDKLSEELFLKMKTLHDDSCVHIDLDISDDVQSEFNDFLKAEGKYAPTPMMGPNHDISDVNFAVTVDGGKYYLNGVKNPKLNLIAGVKYTFSFTDATFVAHPLRINGKNVSDKMVKINPVKKKITVQLPVDSTATDVIYNCAFHSDMGNTINVVANPPTTYTVTEKDSKYHLNEDPYPVIALNRGVTYKFDVSQINMDRHPFQIGTRGQTDMPNMHDSRDMGFIEAVTLSDKGYDVTKNIEATKFNEDFKKCPVVQYTRNSMVHSVYMRTSPIPDGFNAYDLFTHTWSDTDNVLNTDFEIYDNKDDLLEGKYKWMVCNYNDEDVGYPRDCGKERRVSNKWFSMPYGRHEARGLVRGASFHIHSAGGCPSVLGAEIPYVLGFDYNTVENVVTFVVPMKAPPMLTYYCTKHPGMGNNIIVPAMDDMSHRRLQEYVPDHDHGHDMDITYDMACVQKYPNNPRFAMQMSLYCMTAFFSHGDVSTALFDSPYEISSSCDTMMRMHDRTSEPSPVHTPSAFCDQDIENDTCTVRAYVRPYIGRTCKSYCESFPGLSCASAHILTDRGEGEHCQARRELTCEAEQTKKDYMLCTCGTVDEGAVNLDKDLTLSATKLLVKPQTEILLCHQDFNNDIVKVFTSYRQTCSKFCNSAGLTCLKGVKAESSTCITRYEHQDAIANGCEIRTDKQLCTCGPNGDLSRRSLDSNGANIERNMENTGSFSDKVVVSGYGASVISDFNNKFNKQFKACPVVQYTRDGSVYAVYKRITPIPNDFNAYKLFTNKWIDTNNVLNKDFELYDNIDNLHNSFEKWGKCNYNSEDVGFPRDCGKTKLKGGRWFTMPGGKHSSNARNGASFAVHSSNECPSNQGEYTKKTEHNLFAAAESEFNTLVAIEVYVEKNDGEDEFNKAFKACPVVQYTRDGSVYAVYKRRATIPNDFNAYKLFTNTWADKDNRLNVDFELYDTIDHVNKSNEKWMYCNYNDDDVGFPRDCGKTKKKGGRWFTMPGGEHSSNAKNGASFAVHSPQGCPISTLIDQYTTTAVNNIACKRMAMQPNNGIRSYYGANSITPNKLDSCTVEVYTDDYNTCNKFCSAFQYMQCVGAHSNADAIFQNGTSDGYDTVSDSKYSAYQCELDMEAMKEENSRVSKPTSNACINLAFSGDLTSHEIYEYCDSDGNDENTCTVNVNAKKLDTTCSEFCSSHQDMKCVSASETNSHTERMQCKADNSLDCDEKSMDDYLQCECGFVSDSERADILKQGPVLMKNTQDYCPAYTANHANESDRRYQKVTLTLGVDTDPDGSIPVVAAKIAQDHSDSNLDSYNTQDVEVCDGLEFKTPEVDDPPEMCSFGHRSDKGSNCYGKLEMSFAKASEKCAARNGHLLRIDDENEFKKLSNLFRRQTFSIGLHSDNTSEGFEWDGYPNCKGNDDILKMSDYIEIQNLGKDIKKDCWQLNLKENRLEPHYCTDTKTWICEAFRPTETSQNKKQCKSDSEVNGNGGDLMKDEGGFCIWYLEDRVLSLPDDESGGFRNTEIANFLAFSEDTRTRKYYKEYDELIGSAEFRGHYGNQDNWEGLTRMKLGLDSHDPIVDIDHETDDFHCHFSPTNFGISRIYLQQHMLERIYPGAFKKHCFCGYKHLGKLVSRCDCTKNGVRNSNCQKEHRPLLFSSTYKENGEYVYCNNGQCEQASP